MAEQTGELSAATRTGIREEALRLQAKATGRGLTLRLIGSIAIDLLGPTPAGLLTRLGRRPARDIDYVAYAREQRALESIFDEEGWIEDPVIRQAKEWGVRRLIYVHPTTRHKVDVFLDELVMSHTIDMRGRLELDAPAVTLVDLVLSKLQIHEITDNDLLDLIVLLAEHDLGDGRNRTIDMPRLLAVTSQDWGLYHTASLNLLQVLVALERLEGLPAATAAAVRSRIAELQARMEVEPKSRRWRLRAALGTRVQWYQDVDEVERGA